MTVSHVVLPFGWIASPSYFQLLGIDIQALREAYGMGDIGWSRSGPFSPLIRFGDAIWVGSSFGSRLSGSVDACGWDGNRMMNDGAAIQVKADLEVQWWGCVGTVFSVGHRI